LTIGTIGFGILRVSGSSLDPTPAARIIAFIMFGASLLVE